MRYSTGWDGRTEDKANLWKTDSAVALAATTYSSDQLLDGTLADPTPYPAGSIRWGHTATEGFAYSWVVAWPDYVYP